MFLLVKCLLLSVVLCYGTCTTPSGGDSPANVRNDPCPKSCVCTGNPDARRVDCSNLNMTKIPSEIGPATTILDLSWNSIRDVPSYGSSFSHLPRLQELNMANNFLESIPEAAFLKLSNLRSLHLQNNKLRSIPSSSFKPLVNLENLYLSFNELSSLPDHSFSMISSIKKLFVDGNNLQQIPLTALLPLTRLESLNLASNGITSVPDYAFKNLKKLSYLCLKYNHIEYIGLEAFNGLLSLKELEINGNQLLELPQALSNLPMLKELSFADNKIRYLSKTSFIGNPNITVLELSGNPLESFDRSTFSMLPYLKKLTLSEARLLEDFPKFQGTSSLEHLRIDRAKLRHVPEDLCEEVPLLRSLDLKSNKLTELPVLGKCKELRLIDLSYNSITAIEDHAFIGQANLIDLFLAHNLISKLTKDSFSGLKNLQVLDMESNEVEEIHPDSFIFFKDLRDLNLGANKFPKLPINGLQNLRHLKTFNNRNLKDFPNIQSFPRISSLALSYAYHCCAFMSAFGHRSSARSTSSLQETIVWLSKDDVDMSAWNSNVSDIWPGTGNFSTKFEEFANQLWKTFGRDYTIPPEEYFEDYKSALINEENPIARFHVQCLPEPGPFMPCEDLFGWWSLRCGVWVVFLLSLLGNGVVVIVLLIGRSKMDVPRFLVCNLASADFFMGVYLGILAVVDASTLGEFKVSAVKWQTSFGCEIAGFLCVLSSELSVFTLSVITLERNYAITHAMRLNKRLSLRHAGYIMMIGWVFAGSMASLPLLGISDYKKFAICLPFETEDALSLSYVIFIILINGVAFLILMGCYLKMYCAIRGSSAWNSNDSRIARRMALLVFTDFLCWAPIAFFSLTAVCGLELISLEEAKVFAIFVLPLNSCANPFLYAIFTKQFKKDCIHICKRIEESRVTRGIGRGRHSSNFSNRHTPVTTNSAAQGGTPGSEGDPQRSRNLSTDVCHCSKISWKPKDRPNGWKAWALKYILCRRKRSDQNQADGYTYAIAQIQKNLEKRNKHTSISSENFSSRSDSWRQGNIPLRLLDQDARRGSWSLQRKISEDSNMSCSRQDSSTSTFHMSRSSFSSDSSSQPRPARPLLGTAIMNNRESIRSSRENKPKLCRQSAVIDEKSQSTNRHSVARKLSKEKSVDELCPVCAKREGFKSKELEEKFACFYNRLVESSCGESSEYSSKEDQIIFSSDIQSLDEKTGEEPENLSIDTSIPRPRIEVNPMAENKNIDFSADGLSGKISYRDPPPDNISERHLSIKDCEIGKCKSLLDINTKVSVEKTKKSCSDNALVKLSLGNLPVTFKSFPSQETFDVKITETVIKPSSSAVMRSSKSENVVPDCILDRSRTQIVKNDFEEEEEQDTDHLHLSLLSSTVTKENETKASSTPNITIKNGETSPLIDNNEE